jgi:6-phosphofructokinase 2
VTDNIAITPNPAVDLSTSVDKIVPVYKLRGTSQRRDPGGGGINVARMIKRLGGDAKITAHAPQNLNENDRGQQRRDEPSAKSIGASVAILTS